MADPSSRAAGSPGSLPGDLLSGDLPPPFADPARTRVSGAAAGQSPSPSPSPSPGAGASPAEAANAAPLAVPESFERALGELEQIVQRMESGSLSLEDSLSAYRRGASLVAHCRKSLSDVQQQVRVLEADLLRPFDPDLRGGEPDAPENPR